MGLSQVRRPKTEETLCNGTSYNLCFQKHGYMTSMWNQFEGFVYIGILRQEDHTRCTASILLAQDSIMCLMLGQRYSLFTSRCTMI